MLKKYDGLLIFAGSAKDDVLEKALERVSSEITRLGGSVDTTDTLGRRTFARPMRKRENGVYVKVQFQLPPSNIVPLRARLRLSEDIFRAQLLVRDERFEAARQADHAIRVAHQESVEAAPPPPGGRTSGRGMTFTPGGGSYGQLQPCDPSRQSHP